MILPRELKDIDNPAKATTTPTYGAKLSLGLSRLEVGIGFNNWKLQYIQPPQTIHELPFMYGDYDGFKTTIKYNMYQGFANYKIQKTPSYFYAGLNVSYFIVQTNDILHTTPYMSSTKYGIPPKATREESGTVYGIQVGYNLNLINGLNVQLETGFKTLNQIIKTLERLENPPYYPSQIREENGIVSIINIPLTFGISYTF